MGTPDRSDATIQGGLSDADKRRNVIRQLAQTDLGHGPIPLRSREDGKPLGLVAGLGFRPDPS